MFLHVQAKYAKPLEHWQRSPEECELFKRDRVLQRFLLEMDEVYSRKRPFPWFVPSFWRTPWWEYMVRERSKAVEQKWSEVHEMTFSLLPNKRTVSWRKQIAAAAARCHKKGASAPIRAADSSQEVFVPLVSTDFQNRSLRRSYWHRAGNLLSSPLLSSH